MTIKARVLAHSIAPSGSKLITFELQYPRIIHSEFLTHRVFSRCSASSRAIPFAKMQEQLTGIPVRFGKNVSGMQDAGEHTELINGAYTPEEWWELAKMSASKFSERFYSAGYHKQIYNRLTEPFQMMKTVLSTTEIANFMHLRDDSAVDPTLEALAKAMRDAMEASKPVLVKAGEWHLPYIHKSSVQLGCKLKQRYFVDESEEQEISLEEAIKLSCTRCAAVSYRNEGYGMEKALEIYDRLVGSDKKHASALEHCATPMENYDSVNIPSYFNTWQKGISHVDRQGNFWSGNFKGFIQYRKLIDGENFSG